MREGKARASSDLVSPQVELPRRLSAKLSLRCPGNLFGLCMSSSNYSDNVHSSLLLQRRGFGRSFTNAPSHTSLAKLDWESIHTNQAQTRQRQ